MKASTRLLVIVWLLTGLPAITQAQPDALKRLQFIKEHIRVWVLNEPNVDAPEFHSVNPEGIFLDTDGIIFGKKGNSGMDVNALFVSSIFKDPTKRGNAGDGELQDVLYEILKLLKNPVDIYFINDVAKPLEEKYLKQYGYFTLGTGDDIKIFPGVYAPEDNTPSDGTIVLGQKLYDNKAILTRYKKQFVYLVTRLLLKDYGPAISVVINSADNSKPPKEMFIQNPLNYITVNNDASKAVTQAIAFSLAGYSTSDRRWLTKYYDEWLGNGPYLTVLGKSPGKAVPDGLKDIPENFILENLITKDLAAMTPFHGYSLTSPPFEKAIADEGNWKIYGLNMLTNRRIIQNEIVLGLLCEQFWQKYGIDKFLEAVTLNDSKLLKTTADNRLAVLVENLSNMPLSGNTPAASPVNLFPLALVDLFLEFPTEGSSLLNLSKFDNTFLGTVAPGSISRPLLEAYYKIRPQVYEAAKKADKKEGIGHLTSGYDNVFAMVNAIWTFLHQ